MPAATSATVPSFPRQRQPVQPGTRRIQLPRTRLVLESRNLFGESAPRRRPQFRNY